MSDQPEQTHIYATPPITQFENISSQPALPPKIQISIPLPLTRGLPAQKQIIWMLLYSLFMILNIVGSIFCMNAVSAAGGFLALLIYLPVCFYFAGLVVPASSLLSGALFGSWRGTIVAGLSISSGLLLTALLRIIPFEGSGAFYMLQALIPLLPATFIVGLIYDFRKYRHSGKSLLTMLLGTFVGTIGLFFVFPYGMLACMITFLMLPTWTILMMFMDIILERSIARYKRRHDATKEVPHTNFSYATSVESDRANTL